jgi:branched-chain amino acid transport system permease protein
MVEQHASLARRLGGEPARLGGLLRAATWLLAIAAYFVLVPLFFRDHSYILNVIITASMLGFISLGVWLTFVIGRINIGQGGFAVIGGYTTAVLVAHLGVSYWVCLPLSGLVAGLVGLAIGWPILRLKGVYFAMITISLTEAIRLVFLNATFLTRGASGMVDLPLPGELALFGLAIIPAFEPGERVPFFYLSATLLAFGLLFLWLVDTSRVGLVFRSLQQNDGLAASVGVNVEKYRVIAYAICCAYGGIGGAFFTAFQQNIYPSSYQVIDSVYFMIYSFVGGLAYLLGPVVGAFLLTIAFEVLRELQAYQTVIYAGLMIACILFLPNGVLSLGDPLKRWMRK